MLAHCWPTVAAVCVAPAYLTPITDTHTPSGVRTISLTCGRRLQQQGNVLLCWSQLCSQQLAACGAHLEAELAQRSCVKGWLL